MPTDQKNNCWDENNIMQDSKLFIKIVSVDKNKSNNIAVNHSNKKENLKVQIDIDNISFSTEERVFNEGVCYFQNNIF